MSTPTMNHGSHMNPQQQQQINETQHTHSSSDNSTHGTLTRSDSTSTVILEEEETPTRRRNRPATQLPSFWPNISTQLRSFLKTSGLFNKDSESTDKWNELFASGNGFTLQRLLSEAGVNDVHIDMNELAKIDSNRLLDARTLSEFLRSESFDQLMTSINNNNPDLLSNPPAMPCSSSSFSELQPLSPELLPNNIFQSQYGTESSNPVLNTPMSSFRTPPPQQPTNMLSQSALNAFEHDHAFLSKRTQVQAQESCRKSSRLRSRARGPMAPEETRSKKSQSRNVNRAKDIKNSDDLTYYLERRRKNNEASKISRAVRKQKFGDMDHRCQEYERTNAELQMKINTLEAVTASLKSGLVNNFQRKSAI
ncbi:unnamed protein product [Adineta ricciae]|uniref:BZIP domain-containing protein n=1 Tax=Adineta ricciae TaxID=249248 RepID=A0A815WPN2_ADIRI|nr:unnamed protein product [Adineta ricciae]CAF1546122.1 unnamed protein product [Adineta ricciae]